MEKILSQMAELWSLTRKGYLDGRIKIGRLIRRYLKMFISASPKCYRTARAEALRVAAKRMGVGAFMVRSFICISVVVDLLSAKGEVGRLRYGHLRLLSVFVVRGPGEEWSVKEVKGDDPKELYRKAAAEGWDSVNDQVPALEVKRRGGPPRREKAPGPAGSVMSIARLAAPKDLAEMIVGMVQNSESPGLVAEMVMRSLAKMPRSQNERSA